MTILVIDFFHYKTDTMYKYKNTFIMRNINHLNSVPIYIYNTIVRKRGQKDSRSDEVQYTLCQNVLQKISDQ